MVKPRPSNGFCNIPFPMQLPSMAEPCTAKTCACHIYIGLQPLESRKRRGGLDEVPDEVADEVPKYIRHSSAMTCLHSFDAAKQQPKTSSSSQAAKQQPSSSQAAAKQPSSSSSSRQEAADKKQQRSSSRQAAARRDRSVKTGSVDLLPFNLFPIAFCYY